MRGVVRRTADMDWQPSPGAGVWRKRLEPDGAVEAGQVTSVVRFDPGARFPRHAHPDGEEILVLDGVFSDETGDYPAGSHLLNPDGTSHAPWSGPGCTLFVVLEDGPGGHGAGSWLRRWPGGAHRWHAPEGCLLYVKQGHLGRYEEGGQAPAPAR